MGKRLLDPFVEVLRFLALLKLGSEVEAGISLSSVCDRDKPPTLEGF